MKKRRCKKCHKKFYIFNWETTKFCDKCIIKDIEKNPVDNYLEFGEDEMECDR